MNVHGYHQWKHWSDKVGWRPDMWWCFRNKVLCVLWRRPTVLFISAFSPDRRPSWPTTPSTSVCVTSCLLSSAWPSSSHASSYFQYGKGPHDGCTADMNILLILPSGSLFHQLSNEVTLPVGWIVKWAATHALTRTRALASCCHSTGRYSDLRL